MKDLRCKWLHIVLLPASEVSRKGKIWDRKPVSGCLGLGLQGTVDCTWIQGTFGWGQCPEVMVLLLVQGFKFTKNPQTVYLQCMVGKLYLCKAVAHKIIPLGPSLLGCPLNAAVFQDSTGPSSLTLHTLFLLPLRALPSTQVTPRTTSLSPLLSPVLPLSPFHLSPQCPML